MNMLLRIYLLTALLLIFSCLSYDRQVYAQEPPLILVLCTQESEPYSLARNAFQEHLSRYYPDAAYLHHHITEESDGDLVNIVSDSGGRQPSLILTLGTRSAQWAQYYFPETPLIATMILSDAVLESHAQHTGILLTLPPKLQLDWLIKFIPNIKRVGILYNPEHNSDWLLEAEREAAALGLEIIGVEIFSAKQLQDRLSIISKNADVLLAIPDQTVYSGRTAKEVLLFSYRNRIPFVGLSSSWVKAGALYALEVDYGHLGVKCAEKAKIIIEGNPAGAIPLSSPSKVTYTVNERTRKYLRLEISPGLIQGASRIFE